MILFIVILLFVLCSSLGIWYFFSTQMNEVAQTLSTHATTSQESASATANVPSTKDVITTFYGDMKTMNSNIQSTLSNDRASLKADNDNQYAWAKMMFNVQKQVVMDEINASAQSFNSSLGKVKTLQEQQQTLIGKNFLGTKQEILDSGSQWSKQTSNMGISFNTYLSNVTKSQSTLAANVTSEVNGINYIQQQHGQFITTYPQYIATTFSNLSKQVTSNKASYDAYASTSGTNMTSMSNDIKSLKSGYVTLSNQFANSSAFENPQYDMRLANTQSNMAYLSSNSDMQFKQIGSTFDLYNVKVDNISQLSDQYAKSVLKSSKQYVDQENTATLVKYKTLFDSNMAAFSNQLQNEDLVLRQLSDKQYTASKVYSDTQLASMSNVLKQYSTGLYNQMYAQEQSDINNVKNQFTSLGKDLDNAFGVAFTAIDKTWNTMQTSEAALSKSIQNVDAYARTLDTKFSNLDTAFLTDLTGLVNGMTASNTYLKSAIGDTTNKANATQTQLEATTNKANATQAKLDMTQTQANQVQSLAQATDAKVGQVLTFAQTTQAQLGQLQDLTKSAQTQGQATQTLAQANQIKVSQVQDQITTLLAKVAALETTIGQVGAAETTLATTQAKQQVAMANTGCAVATDVRGSFSVFSLALPTPDPASEVALTPVIPYALANAALLSAAALSTTKAVYTLMFRINITNTNPNWRNLLYFGQSDNPGDRSPGIWQYPSGTQIHFRHMSTSDGNSGIGALPIPSINAWHHLVFTVDGTTMRAYVNGVPMPDYTLTLGSGQYFRWSNGSYTILQKRMRARIADNGYAQTSGAQMADVFMFPMVFSDADVSATFSVLYNSSRALGGGGTVCPPLRRARYVQLDAAAQDCMNIAELQVFDDTGTNVAAGKKVIMSSGYNGNDMFPGGNLVDNNINNFAHTSCYDRGWMRVDLGSTMRITRLRMYNRVDCCQWRSVGTTVSLLDENMNNVFTSGPLTGDMVQDVLT